MNGMIRALCDTDWPEVERIYREGILTGIATFQTETPEWTAWDAGHRKDCRLVACNADDPARVLGFAVLSPTSARPAYAGVAEVSVYVDAACRGQGVGTGLLEALVACSEAAGLWTLQSGIISRNSASIGLHQRCGFRIIGIRERVARLASGEWSDVTLMERRSPRVGV